MDVHPEPWIPSLEKRHAQPTAMAPTDAFRDGFDHARCGDRYDLVPPNDAKTLRPVGEFNESRILVQGKHVEHWLNGARIVQYELESPALFEAVAKSKYKDIPRFGTKFKTRILLQDHGDEVWFRNLRIRPLAP
jgi:hypothetical protein